MSTTAASSTPEGPVPQSGLSEGSGAHAHAQAQFRCGTLTSPQQAAAADGLASDSGAGNDTVRNPEHAEHAESGASVAKVPAKATGLVMQIILRRDLLTKHAWPIGPLLAQSAHASTAVLHLFKNHPDVKRYLEGEDGRGWEVMRKVTYEVEDEDALRSIADKLDEAEGKGKVGYHLWIEQPENIPTALALVPNKRPKALKKILDEAGCKLFS